MNSNNNDIVIMKFSDKINCKPNQINKHEINKIHCIILINMITFSLIRTFTNSKFKSIQINCYYGEYILNFQISHFIAESIRRNHNAESIGSLFNEIPF